MPAMTETDSPRIFLIDDDPKYNAELSSYLELYGCEVRSTTDPRQLESVLAAFEPNLILLDQRLGSTTGTQVLRDLRSRSSVPCIVVTGLPDMMDRVLNLEIGADDEVDKSVSPRELLARIRAVIRRSLRRAAAAEQEGGAASMGGWSFLPKVRELRRPDGSVCHLTSAEFDTLQLLYASAGKPVQRAAICERVFGRPFRAGDRSVDTVIAKLRRKLEPDGAGRAIKTVRPFGYVFVGFPGDDKP